MPSQEGAEDNSSQKSNPHPTLRDLDPATNDKTTANGASLPKQERTTEVLSSPAPEQSATPNETAPANTAAGDIPLLNKEDEDFLHRVATQSEEGKAQTTGKDAQIALMAGANDVPLPASPSEGDAKPRNYFNYIPKLPSIVSIPSIRGYGTSKSSNRTDAELNAAGESAKTDEGIVLNEDGTVNENTTEKEEKEKKELTSILDRLDLSAVNNRLFSISKDTQHLMDEFTLVLKDIIDGAPTAYEDLERFLSRSEGKLNQLFKEMPPFVQTLVKTLPTKLTSSLAPEVMAAMSAKPGFDAANLESSGANANANVKTNVDTASNPTTKASTSTKSKKSRIPSLKKLVSEQGAVASMLRSTLNFLKLRFPTFVTGTNMLMSIAVFVVLFVFWYCHKRGRETRLTKEDEARLSATEERQDESEIEGSDSEASAILNQSDPATVPLPEECEKAEIKEGGKEELKEGVKPEQKESEKDQERTL